MCTQCLVVITSLILMIMLSLLGYGVWYVYTDDYGMPSFMLILLTIMTILEIVSWEAYKPQNYVWYRR